MIAYRFIDGGNDPASLAIKTYQRGAWATHVDCVLPAGCGFAPAGYMLGARSDSIRGIPAGVQVRPPDYTNFVRSELIEIGCTDQQEKDWLAFLQSQLGKPYDLVDLLADFVGGRDWRDDSKWWCSELGARAGEMSFLRHALSDSTIICPEDWRLVASSWQGF